jgi:filamentous hemagglutinin family protein
MKTTKKDRIYQTSLSSKILSVFLVSILTLSPGGLLARNLPTGANVIKGGVTITVDGKTMNIDQSTAKAIVNWDTFDIGMGYAVNVDQISRNAAMLSRVIGGNPSEILGRLSATGHFYLINPAGILFGKNAQVDVNKFIASTLDLSDENFMADKLIFEGNSDASIINEGVINAEAAALVGKHVTNTGTINAQQVALLGTQSVELGKIHGGKLSIDFSGLTQESTVTNEGVINATDLGDVVLFAEGGTADNAQGTIVSDTLEISGDFVNIFALGTLDVNSLLIDPNGTLKIAHGGETAGINWSQDDLTASDADLAKLIVDTGANVELKFDHFHFSSDGGNTLTVASSDKNLTLNTNADDGKFTIDDGVTFNYTGTGDLIIKTGYFSVHTGAIKADDKVTVEGKSPTVALNLPGITAGGALTVTSKQNIVQSGPLKIGSTTDLNVQDNRSIILDNAGNEMLGLISISSPSEILTNVKLINAGGSAADKTALGLPKELTGTLDVNITKGGLDLRNVTTGTLTVGGNITLTSAGMIESLPGNLVSTTGDIQLTAGDKVDIYGNITATDGSIRINAVKNITTDPDVGLPPVVADLTAEYALTLHSTEGDVIIRDKLETKDATFGDLVVTADTGNITLWDIVTVANDTYLKAGNGKNIIAQNNNAMTGDIIVSAVGDGSVLNDVTISNSLDTILKLPTKIGGDLVASGDDLTIADVAGSLITVTGSIQLDADGKINTKPALTSENSFIDFDAVGYITVEKALTAKDSVDINSTGVGGGISTQADGAINAGTYVTLKADEEGITVLDSITTTDGAISLDAKKSVNIVGAGGDTTKLSAKGDAGYIDIKAGKDVNVGAVGWADLTSEKSYIKVDAGGTALFSGMTAGTYIDITAEGKIELYYDTIASGTNAAGVGIKILSKGTTLGDIISDSNMYAQTGSIDIVNQYGDITLNSNTISAKTDVMITADKGAVTVGDATTDTLTANDGEIKITAKDDIIIKSTLTAGTNVEIESKDGTIDAAQAITATAGYIDVEADGNILFSGALEAGGANAAGFGINIHSGATLGDITLTDDATMNATAGSIKLYNELGAIDLKSDEVVASGDVIITTDAGDIYAGDNTDDFLTATGGKIDIFATTGDIKTKTSMTAGTDVSIASDNGNITVGSALGGSYTVDAGGDILIKTEAGKIDTYAKMKAGKGVKIWAVKDTGNVTINEDITAEDGNIDIDASGTPGATLTIDNATLLAGAENAAVMLNAYGNLTVQNDSKITADKNLWLHSNVGDIDLTKTTITSNNGSVDVYAATNHSTITMDANSSITAGEDVTISAHGKTTAGNISAGRDILLSSRNNTLEVLAGNGVKSTTAGDIYLHASDMIIGADVATTAGDIYVYRGGGGFTLGSNIGFGVKLNADEIGHLKADDEHALIIGRGRRYKVPDNILTDMGGFDVFQITDNDIRQRGNATAASKNVGLITNAAITRTGNYYLTTIADGSLALVANNEITFGVNGIVSLDLAALNKLGNDIELFLGSVNTDYNVTSFVDGTDPVATGLGQDVIGIENRAAGEDIIVAAAGTGNTLNINADVKGTAGGVTRNDIIFRMAENDIVQDAKADILAADGEVGIWVHDMKIAYVEGRNVAIVHSGDVIDNNDGDGVKLNVKATSLYTEADGVDAGVFGLGDAIETELDIIQLVTAEDVNIVNYGDLTIGGASFTLDGLAETRYGTDGGITIDPTIGIKQSAGDTYVDVGVNRIFVNGTITQDDGAGPYGGNVTLVAADIVLNQDITTGADADGNGGRISLIPAYKYTNITVTGYGVDGSALTDPELGRQWVFDMNNLARMKTNGEIVIGQEGHYGDLRFDGQGSDVDLAGNVKAWTFYGGDTYFASNTKFDTADTLNLHATGAINYDDVNEATVEGGNLISESVGGYNLKTKFANLDILNAEGLANAGVTVFNNDATNPAAATITVRNYSGDVTITNYGALTLGDVNTGLASFTKDGDFYAIAMSPLTVATDIFTIGTGDIILEAYGAGDLTVNSNITINAEAGAVVLWTEEDNIVFGGGPGWLPITISGSEAVIIMAAAGGINVNESTSINSAFTSLTTAWGNDLTINNNSDLILTGKDAEIFADNVTGDGTGYLDAQLAFLDFYVKNVEVYEIDLSAVELTDFSTSASFITAAKIALGETMSTEDLTITGALTLHDSLNIGGKLTIGTYGAALRNAFDGAEISADVIDIMASTVTNSTFTATDTATLNAIAIGGTEIVAANDINVAGTIGTSGLTSQAGKITITNATYGVTNVTASAGGDIEATTGIGWIAGGSYIAGGNVEATAAYTIYDAIFEGADVTLTANNTDGVAAAMNNLDITARNDAVLTAIGTIANSTIAAANDITVTGAIVESKLTAQNDVEIKEAAFVTNNTVTADGKITLTDTIGNLVGGSYVATDTIEVDAAMVANAAFDSGETVTLYSAGNIELADVKGNKGAELDAGGSISGTTVTANSGDMFIGAEIIDGSEFQMKNGYVDVNAAQMINSSITAQGDPDDPDVYVLVDVISGSSIFVENDLEVSSSSITNSNLNSGSGTVLVANTAALENVDIAALGKVTVGANDATGGSWLSYEGDLEIGVKYISGVTMSAANGAAAGTGNVDIATESIKNSSVFANDKLTVYSTNSDVDIIGSTLTAYSYDDDAISLKPGTDKVLRISGTTVNTFGGIIAEGVEVLNDSGLTAIKAVTVTGADPATSMIANTSIASQTGNITIAKIANGITNVTASAGGDIIATDTISWIAGGSYIAGGNVDATVTYTIYDATFEGADVTLTANNAASAAAAISNLDITARNNAVLTATGAIANSTIAAANDITVTGTIVESKLTAQNDVEIKEAAFVTNNTVTADGKITLNDNIGNLVGGSYVATEAIDVDAVLVASAAFDSGDVVTLDATGKIELVDVKANKGASLTSAAGIDSATVIANNNDVTLSAAHIVSSKVTAENGAASLTATGLIANTIVGATGDVTFTAANLDNLTVTGGGVIDGKLVTGNIVGGSYIASGNITFDDAALIASASFDSGNVVTLGASGKIELVDVKANKGASLSSAVGIDSATVIADNNDVTLHVGSTVPGAIVNSTVTAQDGNVILEAVGILHGPLGIIVNTAVAASGNVTFEAADLDNLTVSSGGVINGTLVNGNIVGGSYIASDSITFDNAATIASAAFDSGDVVTLGASGNIELVDVKANDGANLTSAAGIDSATVIANNNDVTLRAVHIVSSKVTAENGAASLTATGAAGIPGLIANTIVGATGDVTFTAANLDNLTVTGGGAIDGTLVTGSIVGGSYVAADAITFNNKDLALVSNAAFDSGDKVTLEATGNIELVDVKANDGATLKAGLIIDGATVIANHNDVTLVAGDLVTGKIANSTVSALDGKVNLLALGPVPGSTAAIINTVAAASGDVTLAAADLDNLTVSSGGAIDGKEVTNKIVGGSYVADGDITFDNKDLALVSSATFDSGANVTLTVDGDILSNIITAATNANLTGAGQIGNNTIDAGETVTLAGKAPGVGGVVDLLNDTVLAKNIVANSNIQNVSGGTYTSTEKTTMNADGEISGVTVQAGGEANLGSVNGDIVNSSIEGTPVILNAAGDISNVAVTAQTTADLTAGTDISGTGVTAGGDVTIEATAGTIQGTTALVGGTMTLTAGKEIDHSGFTATGAITVEATALTDSSFISETGAINVGTVDNIINSTLWAKLGAVEIAGVTDELDGSTITSATSLTLTGNWIVDSALIAEDGLLKVTATTIDGSELLAKAGNAEVDADSIIASSITAINPPAGTVGNVTITGADEIIGSNIFAEEKLTVNAKKAGIENSTLTAHDTVDLTARKAYNVNVFGMYGITAKLDPAFGGELSGGEWKTLGGDINVDTTSISGTEFTARGNVDLKTLASITNAGVTVLGPGNAATLNAFHNIRNTTVASDAAAILKAGSYIADTGVAAGTASLTAAGIGGTTVVAGGNIDVTGTIGESSLTSLTGNVEIEKAVNGITNVTASAGGNIIATTDIGWVAGGSFIASGNVGLTTAATILDAAVEGEVVTLNAKTGTIGTTAIGNVDVTARDKATLSVTGDISNSSVLAENAATLTLTGDLNNNTVTAGSIAITGLVNLENGSYLTKDVDVAGTLTVDASGTIEGATFTAELSSVDLDAVGGILNATVTALTTADLTAGTDISGTGVTAGGNVTIEATAGTIQGTTALGGGTMTLTAGKEIDHSGFTATGAITVEATDLADSSFISETGAINVGTVDNIINSTIWAKLGAVEIAGVTDELDGSTITSATSLTLTGNWIVDSALIAEDGLLKVTATTIDGSELLAKAGNAEVDADSIIAGSITAMGTADGIGTVSLTGGDVSNVNVFANKGITANLGPIFGGDLSGGEWTVTGGDIKVDADSISGTEFTARGNVDLNANFASIINAGVTVLGDGNAATLNAFQNIRNTTVASAAAATLTAGSYIADTSVTAGTASLTAAGIGGTTVVAGGNIDVTGTIGESSLTSLTGKVEIEKAVNGITNVTASAGGNIKATEDIGWVAGGSFIASGDVNLTTAATILDAAVEGEVVTLDAKTGTIGTTAIGNVVVTARDTAELNVTGDISNSSILAENAATLTLTGDLNNNTVTAGKIAITGLVNLENGSYLTKGVGADGTLTVDASGTIEGATFTAELSSVDLDAVGDILNATVTALATADLTARMIGDTDVVAGGNITTSGSLVSSSLSSHANIVITNAAIIDNLDAVCGGTITATDTIGMITGGSLISGGATTVSAQSIRGAAFDAATAALTASSDIQGIDVRVNTNAKLNSASIIDSDVIVSNAGSIEVKATAIDGGSLRADAVSFDEFAAGADIQIGAASAVKVLGAETITVANGGLVNIVSENDQDTTFTVAASDDVFLTQGNGNMLVDITADGQVVTLTAAADINGAVAGTDVTAKNLIITTAENVTLDTDIEQIKANVAYDLTLNEANDLAVDLISAGRKATITVGGSILDSADDTIIDIVTPELALTAVNAIGTMPNALEISTQNLTADATNDLINLLNVSDQEVEVSNLTADGWVIFSAEGSGEHTFTGNVIATDGNVIINSAAGDLSFDESTVTATNSVMISAYGDITTDGTVLMQATDANPDSANDVLIGSTHGTVRLSADTTAKADGNISVASMANDVFARGTLEAGKNVWIYADGWLYSVATILAGENVDLYSYEELTLDGGSVTANNGFVHAFAETGEMDVYAPVTAGTYISLETEDDLIDVNDTLTADAVWLTSEKGDILSGVDGVIEAATIIVETGGKVDMVGKMKASDWVDIEAIGSVTADDIESGNVKVKTTGTNANIDITLTAELTDLEAVAEGIDSDILIVGDDLNLNEVSAFDGDVTVVADSVNAFSVKALDDGVINDVEDDAHSVTIIANRLHMGLIEADYDGVLVVDGDITSDGGMNIVAGNDIDITTSGRVGTVGGNPVTVDAGGDVIVGSLPGTPNYGKSVWVYMQGNSGDGEIHYSGIGNTPPGTIVWNGKVWGGSEMAMIQMDRAEDAIYAEIRNIMQRYDASSQWFYGFLYFPHIRAYMDGYQGNMSIEHILKGSGTVEGLPEGVSPTTVIDFQAIDDSYLWQQDKQASVR